ncbi:MAG TPA: hypothetical protein VGE29_14170 [Prosthecobacter sp.]
MKTLPATAALFLAVSPLLADPAEDARLMRQEASLLETEISQIAPDIHEKDPVLKMLYEESSKATSALQSAMANHAGLAQERMKLNAAEAHLAIALKKRDDDDKRQAQEEVREANTAISLRSREIPELRELNDAAAKAEAEYRKRRNEAYTARPDTAAKAQKMIELRTKADALLKDAK